MLLYCPSATSHSAHGRGNPSNKRHRIATFVRNCCRPQPLPDPHSALDQNYDLLLLQTERFRNAVRTIRPDLAGHIQTASQSCMDEDQSGTGRSWKIHNRPEEPTLPSPFLSRIWFRRFSRRVCLDQRCQKLPLEHRICLGQGQPKRHLSASPSTRPRSRHFPKQLASINSSRACRDRSRPAGST